MAQLYNVDSPITREQRNNINDTFDDIQRRLSNLRLQISVLSGGEDLDSILQSIQDAIDSANNATSDTQQALNNVSQSLDQLNVALQNSEDATNNANQATIDARNEIIAMQNFVNQLGNSETYDNNKNYFKNNIVEYNGSSFIALQETTGNTPPLLPEKRNDFWQLLAQRGVDGSGAVSKVAGKSPEIDGNIELLYSDIGAVGIQDFMLLEEKTEEINKNLVYTTALENLYFNPQQLFYFYRAILKGYCKVAFWGDSITEGIDVPSVRDTYYYKVKSHMEKLFPTVKFDFMNFSLASTGISTTTYDDFVAVNAQPQPNNTFWRPWAVEGKSWKQHVLDFNPDLTFFAFGTNDLGMGNNNSQSFYERLSIIRDMFYIQFQSDLVVVNNMLTTSNEPSIYNINYVNGVAEATRAWCEDNNIALIDANRLSNILLKGEDVKNLSVGESDISMDVSIKTNTVIRETDITKSNLINYRVTDTNCFFQLVILTNDGTNFIAELYFVDNDNRTSLGAYNFVSALNNSIKVEVDCEGANHTVRINDVTAINVRSARGLYKGDVILSSLGTGSFSDTEILKLVPYKTNYTFSEEEILGQTINHPTSLGHNLIYYNAFSAFLKNLTNFNKQTVKKSITNWIPASNDYVPPTGKRLYYSIIDLQYDQSSQLSLLEYGGNFLTREKSNNPTFISDDEFAFFDWNNTQKIVFIAIPEAETPLEGVLNYYKI